MLQHRQQWRRLEQCCRRAVEHWWKESRHPLLTLQPALVSTWLSTWLSLVASLASTQRRSLSWMTSTEVRRMSMVPVSMANTCSARTCN
jgi:hypothetical protein